MTKHFLIGAIVLIALQADIRASDHTIGTKVGQAYPNYVLPSLADGKPLALSTFRGKKTMLHQFASW